LHDFLPRIFKQLSADTATLPVAVGGSGQYRRGARWAVRMGLGAFEQRGRHDRPIKDTGECL
jgi:hypothetical protein